MRVLLEVSVGELIDRMTILEIKAREVQPGVRGRVEAHLDDVRRIRTQQVPDIEGLRQLTDALRSTNRALWNAEEALRGFERRADFGRSFVQVARSVYRLNDQRAALKLAIDRLAGCQLQETKSYALPALG